MHKKEGVRDRCFSKDQRNQTHASYLHQNAQSKIHTSIRKKSKTSHNTKRFVLTMQHKEIAECLLEGIH